MRVINLVYWNGVDNIGDVLSPYIIQRLSGMTIRHKSLCHVERKRQIKYLLKFLHSNTFIVPSPSPPFVTWHRFLAM